MKNKSTTFLDQFNNLVIIISIIFLIYSLHKSGLVLKDTFSIKYLKYIIFFSILSFFFLALKFIKKDFKYNILISCFVLIFMIYILEILSTFIFKNRFSYANHNEIKKEIFLKKNNEAPIYSRLEKREQLKKVGKLDNDTEIMNVVRSEDVKNQMIFPLSGISNKNTIFCNERDKFIFYTSDRYGFNNNDSLWDSSVDIVLMGDSFGHGACVNSKDNISGNLNSSNFKTLNLSFSGNGPLKTLGSLIEYGNKIEAKNYIWLYFEGNDLLELKKEEKNKILEQYLQKNFSQDLINKQTEINEIHYKIIKEAIRDRVKTDNKTSLKNKIISFIKLYNLRISLGIDSPFSVDDHTLKVFENTIVRSKEIINNFDSKLTFVYLPMYLRYDKTLLPKSNLKKKNNVINIIKKHNINYIDLDEIYFSNLKDPLTAFPLKLNGHYTEKVYKDISRIILENI